ncbi:hypothetical protein IscW_ISCW018801, partial [Ixodes scapularis]
GEHPAQLPDVPVGGPAPLLFQPPQQLRAAPLRKAQARRLHLQLAEVHRAGVCGGPRFLATGRIVQVFVDRHADYTVLQVNGNNVTIPHPAVFLTTYYKDPWIQGEQLELVKPARGTFESVPNSQMYLGGVDFMGATTNLPGLVGCLQGLRIGNVQVDLIKDVENQNVTKGSNSMSSKRSSCVTFPQKLHLT